MAQTLKSWLKLTVPRATESDGKEKDLQFKEIISSLFFTADKLFTLTKKYWKTQEMGYKAKNNWGRRKHPLKKIPIKKEIFWNVNSLSCISGDRSHNKKV